MWIFTTFVVILACTGADWRALGERHKHKHEEPGYWDNFKQSLGPAATAFLQNSEVQSVLKMLNSLHERFETKDIEDRLEEFSRMDFGALSALNLGLEDVGEYLSHGMKVLAENPILIQLLSNYLKETGYLPQNSNAIEELFKVLNNLYNSDHISTMMNELKKSLEDQKIIPEKEGRFHFATLRALGDAAIRMSGLRGEYMALEAYNSLVEVFETLLDYLRYVYESVTEKNSTVTLQGVDQPDHKISLLVAIVRDILIVPQEKLHLALRDAESIAADLLALEFVADRYRPTAGSRQTFPQLVEELNGLANEMLVSRQAALDMDQAFERLDDRLIESVVMLKPHLDKLSRDLKIGARSLVALQPAENTQRPKRRTVAQLEPLVREMSEEVAHAVTKIAQLYDVAKRVQHVTDGETFLLFLRRLRTLLVDTPKFETLIDAVDQFYYFIEHMITTTRALSDEL